MRKSFLFLILFLNFCCFLSAGYSRFISERKVPAPDSGISLSQFRNPDIAYAPMVRWWWPGNDVEPEELRRELGLFKDHHIGGVEIQPFALVVPMPAGRADKVMSFDSDSYYDHLAVVMAEAARLGMTVDLTNGSGWPAASPEISEAEENRSLQYGMVDIPTAGGTVSIPRSERQDSEFATLVGLLEAEVKEGEPRQLRRVKTLPLRASSVEFSPGEKPEGGFRRVLIALWSVPSQETNMITARPGGGKVIDHFDSTIVTKTYEYYFGMRSGLIPFYGRPFRAIFNDSYEFKVDRHISNDFQEAFLNRNGYDPVPWMPANIWYGYNNMYDNGHSTPEFTFGENDWRLRYDYDLTVSDLIRKHLLKGSSSWAGEHGLMHRTQAYGLPMDYMGAAGDADIPETENMMFGGGSTGGLKMVSSGAMLYNKSLVTAESGVHLGRALLATPQKLRITVDKFLSGGINQVIWHGTPYKYGENGDWQPFFNGMLGINFSSDIYDANHFWEEISDVNLYAQRSMYAMRQGKASADVLVYYPFLEYSEQSHNPEELLWYGYLPETEPAMRRSESLAATQNARWLEAIWPLLNQLERKGLTWAWVNDESLQEMTAGKDGSLLIRGNSYKGLVLFELPYIPVATARRLADQKNANLLLLGNPPTMQPSFKDYGKNDALVAELMHKVASRKSVCRDFSAWDVVPPARTLQGGERVRLMRRILEDGSLLQYYWNEEDLEKHLVLKTDFPYAFWLNAEDGSVISARRVKDGQIVETLFPLQARILYLGKEPLPAAGSPAALSGSPVETLDLENWTLTSGDSFSETVTLKDWREIPALEDSADDGIYTTVFTLDKVIPGKRYLLDLGDVFYTAEVLVNRKNAGKRIWKPYRFDVTDHLIAGENRIEVRVKVSDYNAKARQGRDGNVDYRSLAQGGRIKNGLCGPVRLLIFQ